MRRAHDTPSTERAEHGQQRSPSRSTATPANALLAARGRSPLDGLGNRATLALWRNGALQRKPRLSEPGDALEHEADRAADAVLSGEYRTPPTRSHSTSGDIQRMPTEDEKLTDALGLGSTGGHGEPQSDMPDESDARAANVVGHLSEGRRLDESTRVLMESRFNESFDAVRIHIGHPAKEAADALQSRAFTVGEDIVFGEGQFAPETTEGTRLLAHELAHVVQQRQPVGAIAGEKDTERDAHEAAREVAGGGTPSVHERAAPETVQKQEGDEVKSTPVQAWSARFTPGEVAIMAREPGRNDKETVGFISGSGGSTPQVSDVGAYEHGGSSGHDVLTVSVGVIGSPVNKSTSPTTRWPNIELHVYEAQPLPPEPDQPDLPTPAPRVPHPQPKPAPPKQQPQQQEPPTPEPLGKPKESEAEQSQATEERLARVRDHLKAREPDVEILAADLKNEELQQLSASERTDLLQFLTDQTGRARRSQDLLVRLLETANPSDAGQLIDALRADDALLTRKIVDVATYGRSKRLHLALQWMYNESVVNELAASNLINTPLVPWPSPTSVFEELDLTHDARTRFRYKLLPPTGAPLIVDGQFAWFQPVRTQPINDLSWLSGKSAVVPGINLPELTDPNFRNQIQTLFYPGSGGAFNGLPSLEGGLFPSTSTFPLAGQDDYLTRYVRGPAPLREDIDPRTPFERKLWLQNFNGWHPLRLPGGEQPIGYQHQVSWYTEVYDIEGKRISFSEIPIESDAISPVDFIPTGLIASGVRAGGSFVARSLINVAGKYAARTAVKEAGEIGTEIVTKELLGTAVEVGTEGLGGAAAKGGGEFLASDLSKVALEETSQGGVKAVGQGAGGDVAKAGTGEAAQMLPKGVSLGEAAEQKALEAAAPKARLLPPKAAAYDGIEGGTSALSQITKKEAGKQIMILEERVVGGNAISVKTLTSSVATEGLVKDNVNLAIRKAYGQQFYPGLSAPRRMPIPGTTDAFKRIYLANPDKITIVIQVPGEATAALKAAAQQAVIDSAYAAELPPVHVIVQTIAK